MGCLLSPTLTHKTFSANPNYSLALKEIKSSRVLYLAIPVEANRDFFSRPFIQTAIAYNEIKLIVYDSDMEVIIEWKN
ncbi:MULTISPECIES: element excision factor XisH family protein [Okeania]|uniref:element excision factor XisH family protein n=1 Tax=Okeania TaxID=1458928 RepID=UPI0013751F98|nr:MULTISPECIES: element excision factor XisH family protein [Okeania]